MEKIKPIVREMLDHSNRIESEYSRVALNDAKKAWLHAMGVEIMTVPRILEIQRLLLQRIEPENVGFRTFPVRIGWQIKPFESNDEFNRRLTILCEWMNTKEEVLDSAMEDLARACHVEFEDIHPFPDGNGRTGRILYNWHRLHLNLPVHIIHEGEEQFEYYKWFDKEKPI